jgi:hypothetical protein
MYHVQLYNTHWHTHTHTHVQKWDAVHSAGGSKKNSEKKFQRGLVFRNLDMVVSLFSHTPEDSFEGHNSQGGLLDWVFGSLLVYLTSLLDDLY